MDRRPISLLCSKIRKTNLRSAQNSTGRSSRAYSRSSLSCSRSSLSCSRSSLSYSRSSLSCSRFSRLNWIIVGSPRITVQYFSRVYFRKGLDHSPYTHTSAVLRLECSLDCISGSVGHQQNIFRSFSHCQRFF